MKRFRSIRWRLQLGYGIFLLLAMTGFGVAIYEIRQLELYRTLDEGLERHLEILQDGEKEAAMRPPPPPPERDGDPSTAPAPKPRSTRRVKLAPEEARPFEATTGYYYAIWLKNGQPLTKSAGAPSELPMPEVGPTENGEQKRIRGELHEIYCQPHPGDFLLVGRSDAAERAELRRLAGLLAGAGLLVWSVGLLIGGWFVRRAIRPIEDISAAAAKIAAGNLAQRIKTRDKDSELGRLVAVLNSTFAKLEDAFVQQTRFTADAAHELRTPVTVMLTHTESALETACEAGEHRESLEACKRAAQRMRRLIESLLELARFDAGQSTLHQEPYDLAAMVEEAMELVEPLAKLRNITLHADLQPAEHVGDAHRLGQVVTNLLSNAIHYNREGGAVTVRTRRSETGVQVSVADNGPGIPAEALPHIFERFYRADKARTTASGRTGLGLAISKAIVEAHGGRITAQSPPGQGATFTVELPRQSKAE